MVLSPLIATAAVFVFLTKYALSEGPDINASLGNPLGFLISNFVYDGLINIGNIVLSCVFLLIIFLFYPRFLKIRSALFLPVFALISGVITMLAAEVACRGACSFYGMSGVSGGIIGFTFANFSVVLVGTFLTRRVRNKKVVEDAKIIEKLPRFTVPALLIAYVLLLLMISGFFSIHQISNSNPFPVAVQLPVSIASESHPVQVGHTSGIVVGFLLYLALFISLSGQISREKLRA